MPSLPATQGRQLSHRELEDLKQAYYKRSEARLQNDKRSVPQPRWLLQRLTPISVRRLFPDGDEPLQHPPSTNCNSGVHVRYTRYIS